MLRYELLLNLVLLVVCYVYVLACIVFSAKASSLFGFSGKSSRKLLHVLVGNLPFLVPFFTLNVFPVNFPLMVAAPFVFVTFLASPCSPTPALSKRLKALTGLAESGHGLGLVYYAFSYTLLALFFASKPYVMAAGILPMAYGDACAALVGEKYGKTRYRVFAEKTVEGSTAMFLASFLSLEVGFLFFSCLYPLQLTSLAWAALAVAAAVTLAESFSPLGFDNLTVPLLGVFTFMLVTGGA
jgi:dolichol kinase